MADPLKIALDRREELHEEIAKLNEFINFAKSLLRTADDHDDGAQQTRQTKKAKEDADEESAETAKSPGNRRQAKQDA